MINVYPRTGATTDAESGDVDNLQLHNAAGIEDVNELHMEEAADA